MTREERSNLILAFARVLYINGESTHQTLGAGERLSNCLGFRTSIFPHWGELEVQTEDTEGKFISAIEAAPSGVDMDRVASTCGQLRFCVVVGWRRPEQWKQSAELQRRHLRQHGCSL